MRLKNKRLLALEGFNLLFGWHAYLIYGKQRNDKFFTHHTVRKDLFQVWQRYKNIYCDKIPAWVIPLEVVRQKVDYDEKVEMSYGDLIYKGKEGLRLKEQTEIEIQLDW